ncbi:ABC transporter permease [candidate division KSB1 bacterium]|nr:ABC transporter permease [candidate division KSB1 bacterium]
MLAYIVRRLLLMIPTIILISMVSFIIIQLPPGDFLSAYIGQLMSQGENVDLELIENLKAQYGLDGPLHIQYLKWVWGGLHGDFGLSFEWNQPVATVIGERLGLTALVSFITLLFTWLVAIPIGVYSATRQYSLMDNLLTFLGFIGLAMPGFLLALVLLYLSVAWFGVNLSGLFSPKYVDAPWSWGKILDLLQHVWIPMIIVGLSGAAEMIRIMRGNLLDELRKPYVITARAKGLRESKLLWKYPVRQAINPFVSNLGNVLPAIVSGATIVAVVLNLPITGPVLLNALVSQDMYLAGTFLMFLAILTIIGTLISDILLAWLDPRIRYD